jgi:hypothetical protein
MRLLPGGRAHRLAQHARGRARASTIERRAARASGPPQVTRCDGAQGRGPRLEAATAAAAPGRVRPRRPRRRPGEYARDDGTQTWEAFEEIIGELEGRQAVAFSSGMAAAAAGFDVLPAGARIVAPTDCYAGVKALLADGQQTRGPTTWSRRDRGTPQLAGTGPAVAAIDERLDLCPGKEGEERVFVPWPARAFRSQPRRRPGYGRRPAR